VNTDVHGWGQRISNWRFEISKRCGDAQGAPLQPTAFSFSCDGVLTHREIEEKLTVMFLEKIRAGIF
jgi:hypothetical protein